MKVRYQTKKQKEKEELTELASEKIEFVMPIGLLYKTKSEKCRKSYIQGILKI